MDTSVAKVTCQRLCSCSISPPPSHFLLFPFLSILAYLLAVMWMHCFRERLRMWSSPSMKPEHFLVRQKIVIFLMLPFKSTNTETGNALLEVKLIYKCTQFKPPMVFLSLTLSGSNAKTSHLCAKHSSEWCPLPQGRCGIFGCFSFASYLCKKCQGYFICWYLFHKAKDIM